MKKHIMNLTPLPLKMIRDGKKTIELRLYDEKRKMISIGDSIEFVNTEDSNDTISVKVVDLFVFDSFDELYNNLPLLECGYTKDDIKTASPDDMEKYYSKEKQKQYGVVGIKISLQNYEGNVSTNEIEQEWKWCLVGNIVEFHEHGEEHIVKYGNKQFRPNAKVFVNLVYGGMGHENIVVIGTPRHTSRYIEIVIARKYVHNFRVQKVFKPAVLDKMKRSDWDWWGNTDEVYEMLTKCLEWLNDDN